MALITRPSEHPVSQDLPQEHSILLSSDCCGPDSGDPVRQAATTPRFFREDPATESPEIKSRLLRSAVKDICDGGGSLEAIESACSRVLSRDARIGVKYTLTNDLVAWMLHRLSGMAESTANHPAMIVLAQLRDRLLAMSTSTTVRPQEIPIIRPGSPTLLEGRTGVDLSQLGPWTAEASLVYLTSLIVQQRAATKILWTLPGSSGPHPSRVPTLQDRIATIVNTTGRPLSPTTDTTPMSESCDDNVVLNIDVGFHAGWAEVFQNRVSRGRSQQARSGHQGGGQRVGEVRPVQRADEVSETHWNVTKQAGVNRVKGRRRDKAKEELRNWLACH